MPFHRWRSPGRAWEKLRLRARGHRDVGTPSEVRLWERLRNRRLMGYKFRRQHAVGGYIVDFFCPEAKLVVEVDGRIHDDQRDADELRERHLAAHGLSVLRIRNEEVDDNLEAVLARIVQALPWEKSSN